MGRRRLSPSLQSLNGEGRPERIGPEGGQKLSSRVPDQTDNSHNPSTISTYTFNPVRTPCVSRFTSGGKNPYNKKKETITFVTLE